MFSQYFGNYLLNKGIISNDQFTSCMEYMRANRVKLGLIAVTAGMLTKAQTNELNHLQTQTDKRFGDLAVEKGYLTEEDISHLLNLQGNPYLIFIQALVENLGMDMDDVISKVSQFQEEEGYDDITMEAIKHGDFERLLPTFVSSKNPDYIDLMALALRYMVRFVSSYIRVDTAEEVTEYSAAYIAYQKTTGDQDGFLGFGSDDDAILAVANGYAGEYFEKPDEDALDSVCEFANCINGLFAAEMSYKDSSIDMLPPEFLFDGEISDPDGFYILPLYIAGKKVDLIIKR